jgi:hypothetical protein
MTSLPENFKELSYRLDKKFNFKNILIVNTTLTGHFLNEMFLEERTTRIMYNHNNYDEFVETITNINTKFDLICVDPYHEYKESIGSFTLLTLLLNDDGILISHDCNPPTFETASPTYTIGEWCGVTYAAFVEIAYNNQDWYYAIVNKDYGLGIISKKEIQYVKKINDIDNQKLFLHIFKENKYEEAFYFFKNHSKNIINLID